MALTKLTSVDKSVAKKLLDTISKDLSTSYVFDTVALMKASAIVFPIGKRLSIKGFELINDGGKSDYIVSSDPRINGDELLLDGKNAQRMNYDVLNVANINTFPKTSGVDGLTGFSDGVITLFAGVDSLTDGAGTNGGAGTDSYFNFVENSLRKKYGDAGVGWVAFDSRSAARSEMSFGRGVNLEYIRVLNQSIAPSIYSLDFGGLHSLTAVIGDYGLLGFEGAISRRWDKCKLYYLQQPNGATFTFKQDGETSVLVDSNGVLSLQSVEVSSVDLGASQVRFDVTVDGACTVFGCYFTNDVTKGVITSRLAYGGFQVAYFSGMDSAFQTQWLSELNPTHYLFNGGRNDISEPYTATEFRDNASIYLSRFPVTTKKLIISPNEADTDDTSDMGDYRRIMRQYAIDNSLGYLDNSKILGEYSEALARGWMLDATHPSALGNEIIAAETLKYLGANIEPWEQPQQFGAAPDDTIYLEGVLTPRSQNNLVQNTSYPLMKLNQASGDVSIVTAVFTIRGSVGTGMIQSEHIFRIINGTVLGAITSTEKYRDGIADTYVVTLQAGGSSDFEIVITPDVGNVNEMNAAITAVYRVGEVPITAGAKLVSVA